MKRIYIKDYVGEEWFWKELCIVNNNDSLKFLEGILKKAKMEYKVEKVQFTTTIIGEGI